MKKVIKERLIPMIIGYFVYMLIKNLWLKATVPNFAGFEFMDKTLLGAIILTVPIAIFLEKRISKEVIDIVGTNVIVIILTLITWQIVIYFAPALANEGISIKILLPIVVVCSLIRDFRKLKRKKVK